MSTTNREQRSGEVRVIDDEEGTIEVLAVAYGVVDDYGTRFIPGVFNESLEQRLPTLTFGHNWMDPIGRGTSWREDPNVGLYVTFRVDRDPDVPRGRQAWAQMKSGTLDDVSVGFMRLADRLAEDKVTDITKGELDEVGVVLRGAVPGSKVLAMRAAGGTVDLDATVELAKKVVAGEVTQQEADETLRMLSVGDGGEPPVAEDEPPAPLPEADAEAAIAEADATIAEIDDRSARR